MRFKLLPAIEPEVNPFTEEELASLSQGSIPRHIAIIMDGNRRWSRERGKRSFQGHIAGLQALAATVQAAHHLGVDRVTVYGFSTENWRRSEAEISGLLRLMRMAVSYYGSQMEKVGVRFRVLGDLSPFPEGLSSALKKIEERTEGGERISLSVALNYGGRDDIRRAALALHDELAAGRLRKEEITEGHLGAFLDSRGMEDPDLLIRTSGEQRLSNFLLWQLSYAELFFLDCYWPDFGAKKLLSVVRSYQERERRRGG